MGWMAWGSSPFSKTLAGSVGLVLSWGMALPALAISLEKMTYANDTLEFLADEPLPSPRWNVWDSALEQNARPGAPQVKVFVLDLPEVRPSVTLNEQVQAILDANPDIKRLTVRQTATGSLRIFLELAAPAKAPIAPRLIRPETGETGPFLLGFQLIDHPGKPNTTLTLAKTLPVKTAAKPVAEPKAALPVKPAPKVVKKPMPPAKVVATRPAPVKPTALAAKPLEKHPPVLNLSSQPPEPIAMLGLSAAPSSDYIPPSAGMITMKGPNGKMETVSLIELVEKQAKRIQQLERQLKEKNAQLAKTGKGGATLDPVLQAQLQQSLREGEVLRQSLATLQAQVNQLQQAQQKAPALPAPTVTALPPGEPFTMATLADTPVTEPAGKPIVPSRVITQKTPLNKKWYNPFPAKKPPFSLKPPSPNKGAEASEPVTMMGVGAAATPAKTTVAEPPMPSWMKNAPPSADSIPLEPVTLGSLETQKPEPLPQEKGARSKAVLRQAIQANPGQPEPYWEMSRILTSEGKYAEAAEILNNLILMDASQILAYAELVELYLKLNKPLDAHINLESYRKVAPMDTQRIESMQQRINMAMSKLVNTP